MKKIKLYAVILIAIFIIGIAGKVNAESVTFTATAGSQTLKEGEEVVITFNISDIDVNENGIYTFGGKLVYDSNIFEEVKDDNFEGKNNWSIAYNNEKTEKEGTFLATRMTGLKTNQEIGTLKLKTKTNIKSTITEIKFIELSSVGEDTIKLDDEVISLSVTGTKKDDDTPSKPNNTTNDDNTIDDNNGNTDDDGNGGGNNSNNGNGNGNNSGNGNNGSGNNNNGNGNNNGSNGNGQTTITLKNTVNSNQSNKDTTANGNKIPQTGEDYMTLVLASVLVLAIMAIAYIKYKKNQDIK